MKDLSFTWQGNGWLSFIAKHDIDILFAGPLVSRSKALRF
jgi:hypothetical protein